MTEYELRNSLKSKGLWVKLVDEVKYLDAQWDALTVEEKTSALDHIARMAEDGAYKHGKLT